MAFVINRCFLQQEGLFFFVSKRGFEVIVGVCRRRGYCIGCLLDGFIVGGGVWGFFQFIFRVLKVFMNFFSSFGGRKFLMKCLFRFIFVNCSVYFVQRSRKGERRKEECREQVRWFYRIGMSFGGSLGLQGNEVVG